MKVKHTIPVLAAVLLTGCVATQQDMINLSQQTDSMTLKVNSLKTVMKDIQGNQADLNTQLEDLHREVSILNENLKDNRSGMTNLGAKMDDLGAVLGMKVSKLGASISDTKNIIAKNESDRLSREKARRAHAAAKARSEADARALAETRQKAAEKAAAELAKKEADARAKELENSGPTPSELYRQAKRSYDKKDYELAAQGFALYVERYPKASLIEDAIYLWGNCFYAEGKYENAARKYATLLDRYPKSDLTPATRMRYALSLMKLKTHLDEARRYLESIPEDFPKSPEASKAGNLLKKWDEKKKS
ncbi:MAG: hypothetical protein COB53_01395 [Elusimicrobia bacterium]|nr:MAG: hypothetical protein COB53_01395 [Elusimicrobiota bacterium]